MTQQDVDMAAADPTKKKAKRDKKKKKKKADVKVVKKAKKKLQTLIEKNPDLPITNSAKDYLKSLG